MLKEKNVFKYIVFFIYAFINSLFVYKYGQRQNIINVWVLLFLYVSFVSALLSVYLNWGCRFFKYNSKTLFKVIIIVVAVLLTIVISCIDGNSLQVDRWSALDLTVEGILFGKYPYTRLDHLGNMSSNFPGLGFLALPFYLLRDVGYLQVFVFLLFGYYLFKKSSSITNAFFILGLYLLSPALLWEITVKSDLVSNFMLVILFIEWWDTKYHNNIFQKPILFGFFISLFILTRGVVLVPIIIYYFKGFLDCEWRTKITIVLSVIGFSFLISSPIILSAPDWETLMNYNPVVLQTNKTPVFSYVLLLVPFFISVAAKKSNNLSFYSAIIIFTIPLISMINSLLINGWNYTIFEHGFDISYLSMSLPFFLIWINNNVKNQRVG